MFFVGLTDRPEDQAAVEQEMVEHGDIVQLGFMDTYENLTMKSVASAVWWNRWRQEVVPGQPWHWLKVEDYMANSFEMILEAVQKDTQSLSQGQHSKLYSGGAIFGGNGVMRKGRWGCPERFCPYEKYPSKYAGGQYLLGSGAVALLEDGLDKLVANGISDVYPIEDHYVASVLEQNGIIVARDKLVWWKGKQPYGPPWVTNHKSGLHFLEHRD